MEFHHKSVLKEEILRFLPTDRSGVYVDCTLGGAGHASALAERLDEKARLVGIDRDAEAIATAKERLAGVRCRVELVRSNFSSLDEILDKLSIEKADGFLFDLGVSSYHLDNVARGFSYKKDAPLDMRMDQSGGLSAYDVVNGYEEGRLAKLLLEYGEERWAKRIAAFIVKARLKRPIATTGELSDLIRHAIPAAARREGGHPAKRTFQAIRIEVNDELSILERSFKTAVKRLKRGGRLCILTFHSLEDRIAKKTLQNLAKGCVCPPRLPICVCHKKPQLRLLEKPIAAGKEELAENPRAKSAKLRVAEKIAD